MDRVDYQPIIVQDIVNWDKARRVESFSLVSATRCMVEPSESIPNKYAFEQKPVPTLYFRHAVDLDADKSLREVVDGQQRIRSILEYIADGYAATHPNFKKKVKYSALSAEQKRHFRETKLSAGILLGANEPDVIEIFGRLNSVAKTLNAQEKRNAQFSGEFKQFCLKQAAARVHLWRDLKIFSANDIARMQEIEFLSDIVLNLINGLSDFSAARLNKLYRSNEDEFAEAKALASVWKLVFRRSLHFLK